MAENRREAIKQLTTGGLLALVAREVTAAPAPELKLGMIGLDTSHVTAFTKLLNDPTLPDHIPGARVVAAFKGGSPDVELSASRVEGFTAELRDQWKVKLVDSIEALVRQVDAVLLTSVDGRTHLAQVTPVLRAKKRVFIDKPLAANYKDAREIVRLSRQTGTPFFSASSLRYVPEFAAARTDPKLSKSAGAFVYGPCPVESHHGDLFFYGIHAVETLFTLLGPGCAAVSRTTTAGADVVVGRWKDGRTGVVRGGREFAKQPYGAVLFGADHVTTLQPPKNHYRPLLVEVIRFFQTGLPPVSTEETLEIMAFMQAADVSKTRQGAEVPLTDLDRV